MKGGWFVGNFEPTAYKTDKFEVCFKFHTKGELWETHYHKEAIEINYLIRGRMSVNGNKFVSGDIFIMEKGEIAKPVFETDCELIVVKTPSIIGDKYIVEEK